MRVYVWEHIDSLNYRIFWWIFTKLGRDKVLMTLHMCFSIIIYWNFANWIFMRNIIVNCRYIYSIYLLHVRNWSCNHFHIVSTFLCLLYDVMNIWINIKKKTKRTILDIAYFRFSHETLLLRVCLIFERRQFKSLRHNFRASEEYELTSATSLWLNIAHAHITNTVKFKALS